MFTLSNHDWKGIISIWMNKKDALIVCRKKRQKGKIGWGGWIRGIIIFAKGGGGSRPIIGQFDEWI